MSRAKKGVLLLALVNLGVLVVGGMLERHQAAPRFLTGYNADKISLAQGPDTPAPVGREASTPAAPASQTPPAQVAEPAPACLVIQDYDQGAHDRLSQSLDRAGLTPAQVSPSLARNLAWWVYLPPEPDAARREALLGRLRAAGIRDMAVIGRGSMTHAIALGMFAQWTQAQAHLAELRAKGVEGALMGPRPESGPLQIDLAGLPADRRAALAGEVAGRLTACP